MNIPLQIMRGKLHGVTQNQLHWYKNCLDCKLLFKNHSNGVNLLKPSSDYREKPTIKPCGKTYFSCMAPTISTSLYDHTAVRLQAKERTCVCVASTTSAL